MVKINRKIMTQNDCYKAGRKTKKKGIMVHLTATSGVMAGQWFSRWNKSGVSKCVHYFLDDKEIWQYLDDDHRGWHGGKNIANNDYIGIEGCEPSGHSYKGSTAVNYDAKKNEKYFNDMYKNYIDLVVHLCRKHGFTEKDVIGHVEGGRKGIASQSSDPHNLFLLHKKSMDIFRADVKRELGGGNAVVFYVRGNTGSGVRKLQEDLNALGYKITVDSSFGPATEKAVKDFQRDNKLTIDGSAGPATLDRVKLLIDKLNFKNEKNILYKVQVGTYSQKDNADKKLEELKEKGIDGFIKTE